MMIGIVVVASLAAMLVGVPHVMITSTGNPTFDVSVHEFEALTLDVTEGPKPIS
jgi:hypothetical protein